MLTGKRRELWDQTAMLRYTIMQCGFARFNNLPSPEKMNPIRIAEMEEEDEDIFSPENDKMAQALLYG
jgi:hypothetical protein